MPRRSCIVCGAPSAGRTNRCPLHPAGPRQQRAYRGIAAYRAFRARIIERDAGICGVCTKPGADELGHRTPYAQQNPATRDDVSTWDEQDFVAVHADCNKRLGARPLEGR